MSVISLATVLIHFCVAFHCDRLTHLSSLSIIWVINQLCQYYSGPSARDSYLSERLAAVFHHPPVFHFRRRNESLFIDVEYARMFDEMKQPLACRVSLITGPFTISVTAC